MKKLYVIPLLLLLTTACAEPAGNGNTANSNAASANANARAEALPAPPLPPNLLPPAASQNGNLAAGQPNGAPDFSSATATKPAADVAKPAEAGGKQPKVMIAARRIDLGTQAPEKTISHSIRVKNEGKSELKIEDVVPGWGCTTVDFPKVLPPGKAGNIKVKVETGKNLGEHTKSVTIKTNDPEEPSLVVHLVFKVKGS